MNSITFTSEGASAGNKGIFIFEWAWSSSLIDSLSKKGRIIWERLYLGLLKRGQYML